MDRREARDLLTTEVQRLRDMSYAQLRDLLGKQDTTEASGPSGTTYQVEVRVLWDSRKKENLRVLVSIDDRGLRAFAPLSADFIVAPEGSFIGE